MNRWAILSDIHERVHRLEAVLRDAEAQEATGYIVLGDVGRDACYDLLRQVGARGVFGNYEVSRWDRCSQKNRSWIWDLPPLLSGNTWLAAHATPYWPNGAQLNDVHAVLDYLLKHEIKWTVLFPWLHEDEDARWLSYAELEDKNKQVFFHGHTHIQEVWRVGTSRAMEKMPAGCQRPKRTLILEAESKYLIGVGSVGSPRDGPYPGYALYDEDKGTVELRVVDEQGVMLNRQTTV